MNITKYSKIPVKVFNVIQYNLVIKVSFLREFENSSRIPGFFSYNNCRFQDFPNR